MSDSVDSVSGSGFDATFPVLAICSVVDTQPMTQTPPPTPTTTSVQRKRRLTDIAEEEDADALSPNSPNLLSQDPGDNGYHRLLSENEKLVYYRAPRAPAAAVVELRDVVGANMDDDVSSVTIDLAQGHVMIARSYQSDITHTEQRYYEFEIVLKDLVRICKLSDQWL